MNIPGLWRVRHLWWKLSHFYHVVSKAAKLAFYAFILFYTTKIAPYRRINFIYENMMVWRASYRKLSKGLNMIGFPKGDFGVAEHMRLATHSIRTAEIPFCVINSNDSGEHSVTNTELLSYITKQNKYKINVFCYNGDRTLDYMNSYKGAIARNNHYNIGYGYWELSEYPGEWLTQDFHLNEFWAPSRFIKEVLEKKSTIPVYYMPIPVDFKIPTHYVRSQFNLPESVFTFLFTFDMSSHLARKNPTAVIEAFSKAFPVSENDSVALVIKVSRIKSNPGQINLFQQLEEQVKFDKRIILVDEVLDRTSILGLIWVCDVYISLHRAEGFGLGMAEAMKMGKVVIATNYSGNVDFMNEENSCPVKYSLVEVKQGDYPMVEPNAVWAEPDTTHAAYWMRKTYDDPAFSKKIGANAKRYIDEQRNFNVIAQHYLKRYQEIASTL